MDTKQCLWTKCSPVYTWWDTLCKVFQRYDFSVRDNWNVTVVDILQNTIIFANNDEDEDMDREYQIIK